MSNNNNAKAAMAAIVSAAQKSVGNHVNMNNNVKINNPVSSSGVKPVASQPQSSNQQKNLSDNQMIKTVAVKNMNNPEQNKIQINEKQISKQPYQKSPIEQITKAQEDIMKVATKALENSASKQVTASLETDFNQRMVSILCDGIRNVHNQSLDFSEKLRQRREEKQKSLCQMQTSTCDDIRALSNTCIEQNKRKTTYYNTISIQLTHKHFN